MTSGVFRTFPVSSIWVDRSKRQRRDLPAIEELAASISSTGLIHPPVIKEDGELIAGERRWTAVKLLGWTDMPVQFAEDLDPAAFRKIELEENVRRIDLTWQDRCRAVEEYHGMREKEDDSWTQEKTAEALNCSSQAVRNFLSVAKELSSGTKLVAEAPKFSTALNITERKRAREKAAVVAAVVAKPLIQTEEAPPPPPPPLIPLLHTDFDLWHRDYDGRKFNLIHCDFPYGVGMHKSDQGAGATFGTYADSADVYWQLLNTLDSSMTNVVAESAHLLFWFSMDYYQPTLEALEKMGWSVNPFPLVWVKSDNTGILPDVNRGPRRIYETAFFASRGDRPIVRAVSNAFSFPGRDKAIHMNEKPRPMLHHFLRMIVDEYTTFLDPTCGSANAVRVARDLGAATVLGLERDETFFNLAKEHFNADD